MRTPVLTFCLCTVLAGVAPAADSMYVRLVGRFDFPVTALGVALGRGHVYVAGFGVLSVISVTDPAHPVEVGRCSTVVYATGVDVAGDFAFVADLGGDTQPSQLRVISVADPVHPVEVGCCSIPGAARAVAVSGDYAYVADADVGLRVISVADPTHPVEVGHCATPGHPYRLRVVGEYAYVAAVGGGLRIISIADPAHPVETGSYTPGGASAIALDGGYAYIGCADSSFRVVSVTDPANPSEVGRVDSLLNYSEDVAVIRGHAFVTNSVGGGLRVISVADPAHPVEVGHYGGEFWSIALDADYVYVGTIGLLILQFYQLGDLDVDNDSLDVVADTVRLHRPGSTGIAVGEFVLANTSASYNPDPIDGPGVSPVDSLRFHGTLVGPGGTLDSVVIPNLPESLAQGQVIVCTLAVHVPPGMPGDYAGAITITGRDTADLLVDETFYAFVQNRYGDLDVDNDSLDVMGDTIRVLPRLLSSRPPPVFTEHALGAFVLTNSSESYNPDTADGPSRSPLDSLRFTGSLTGPGGTIDSILIPDLPYSLSVGQSVICTLRVCVPVGLPCGDYSGPIVITGYDSLHYEVAETVYALVTKLGDLDVDNDSLDVVHDTIDLHTQPAGPAYSPYAKAEFMLVNTSDSYNPDTADGPSLSPLRAVKVEAKVTTGDSPRAGTVPCSVYVLNLPESLAVEQAVECTLALVLPVGTALDGYAGLVIIDAYDTLGYPVRDSFFLRVSGPTWRQNLDSLRVAPIPFKPNQNPEHDAIHFQGLTAGARVIVYDASGQSVWSATETGDGHLKWGAKVASGIYVYLVVSKDGQSRAGKLSVIR
jgi:hypothetical protein